MSEAASATRTDQTATRGDGLPVGERYEPPSLISLGEFGETTLGQGDVYSDDGTKMFK